MLQCLTRHERVAAVHVAAILKWPLRRDPQRCGRWQAGRAGSASRQKQITTEGSGRRPQSWLNDTGVDCDAGGAGFDGTAHDLPVISRATVEGSASLTIWASSNDERA